jgi:hypothetical protein
MLHETNLARDGGGGTDSGGSGSGGRQSRLTYAWSTGGVAAWKRAIHVVAPPPGGVYGVISREEF